MSTSRKEKNPRDEPHDDFAENVGLLPDLFEDVLPFGFLSNASSLNLVLSADDGERTPGGLFVIDVRSSGLKDTADKDDLKESVRVL